MHLFLRRLSLVIVAAALLPACASSHPAPPVVLSPLARFVYCADSDGTVTAFATNPLSAQLTGQGYAATYTTITPPTTAQQVVLSPGQNIAWVLTLGTSPAISTYILNETTGAFIPVTVGVPLAGVGNASVIAVDPLSRFAYVIDTSLTPGIQVLAITGNGTLTPIGTPVSLGAGFVPSSIAVHPSGSILYVSNQSNGTIAGFSVGGGGNLVAVPVSITGSTPVSLKFDPTGGFLFALTQNPNSVWAYTLSTTGQLASVAGSPFPVGGGLVNPTILASDPLDRFVWVGDSTDTFVTLDLELSSGSLFGPPGNVSTLTGVAGALTIDPSGTFAFVACTGFIQSVSVSPTGLLGTVSTSVSRTRGTSPTLLAAVDSLAAVTHTPEFVYAASTAGISGWVIATAVGAVIDPTTGAIITPAVQELLPLSVAPLFAGTAYTSIAADPYSRFVYSVDSVSNALGQFAVDFTTGNLLPLGGTPPVLAGPSLIAVDPSGRFAFVGSAGPGTLAAYPISQTTGQLGAQINSVTVLGISGLAIDPLGASLVAAGSGGLSLITVDAATGKLTLGSTTGGTFNGLTIDPSGRFLYASTGTGVDLFAVQSPPGLGAGSLAGSVTGNAEAVAAAPSGAFLFACTSVQTITAFSVNPGTGALTATPAVIPTGPGPTGMILDPSGQFAFTTAANNGALWSYATSSLNQGQLITLPNSPQPIGPSPSAAVVLSIIQ